MDLHTERVTGETTLFGKKIALRIALNQGASPVEAGEFLFFSPQAIPPGVKLEIQFRSPGREDLQRVGVQTLSCIPANTRTLRDGGFRFYIKAQVLEGVAGEGISTPQAG